MRKLVAKLTSTLALTAAGLMLFTGIASAHVTVKPAVSSPGAWETYTIKIPAEKDLPTVKIALKIPEQVELKQYQPVPDWKIDTTANNAGKLTTITWTATGKGIEAGQFMQFNFVAKNPDQASDIAWDAFQYYSDGSIVEWTGEEGADTPHSITKITPEAAANATSADSAHDTASGDHSANSSANSTADHAEASAADSSSSTTSTLNLIMSAGALIVSLAALWFAVLAARRRKA
ncbi:nuclear export factor gle1 [Paenibacillus sp. CAA11]|uniref:YcnI family copper-binding membrane protein n=1 Tax=Paenibacillus sp. CAA11 TaxID=1532905 RepID=UPI000D371AA9|nr:DUF1775 domain-containing protein [Paenibacillus sp. CAA11]AWB43187.1 nuclear export factor gle1 [Paenibacillus sp. CAA11]